MAVVFPATISLLLTAGNLTGSDNLPLFSALHAAQIHARVLRLNLTSSSPPTPLLLFHNSLIRSLTSLSLHSPSLSLFLSLLSLNLAPNEHTFPFILKSTTHLNSLRLGHQLHAHLLKSPHLLSNAHCACALLDLYVKIGSFGDAVKVFDRMPERSVAIWNAMILGFLRNGYLDIALEMLALMETSDLEVGASTWNSVIAGCVLLGDAELAMKVFGKMAETVRPNESTFNTILSVVPNLQYLDWLKELHGFAIRNVGGIDPVCEDRLQAAIAAGYARNRAMGCASSLFKSVRLRNASLGNSIISGFLNSGQTDEAFSAFRAMAGLCIYESRIISKVSLTLLLPECDRAAKTGLEMHAYALRRGLESNTSIGNALMAMYSTRGDKELVENVFAMLLDKDVVSWNTIIASYATTNEFEQSFNLFQEMLAERLKPDEYTVSTVLNGCGYSSFLRQGMALHGHTIKSGLCQSYPVVQNSLIDAYGKCGCIGDARKVFDEMEWSDNISWNTMISSYAFSACPKEAISLFERMTAQGSWKPNRVTFVALLSACSHAGLLDEGLHYFKAMQEEHGIVPDSDHYTCIVDNLARSGQVEQAYRWVRAMPTAPDEFVWSALLSGCRVHGNAELAEVAAANLRGLEPGHAGYWLLLANVYADASRWGDVRAVRVSMKNVGVKKTPACSWVEVGGGGRGELHRFFNGDKLHEKSSDIYLALHGLTEQLKDDGYA